MIYESYLGGVLIHHGVKGMNGVCVERLNSSGI